MSARSCAARMLDRRQHAGMGKRSLDIGMREPSIEADRCGVALDELGNGLGEAAGPRAAGFTILCATRFGAWLAAWERPFGLVSAAGGLLLDITAGHDDRDMTAVF